MTSTVILHTTACADN